MFEKTKLNEKEATREGPFKKERLSVVFLWSAVNLLNPNKSNWRRVIPTKVT